MPGAGRPRVIGEAVDTGDDSRLPGWNCPAILGSVRREPCTTGISHVAFRAVWHSLNMSEPFDVAIVGAGPAGSMCAYVAARRGLRVALIDRQTFPRDKACGDGISPSAVRIARQVGLGAIFSDDEPVRSVTVWGPDRTQLHMDRLLGYIVPRLDFDRRLFDRALGEGARDFSGMKFTGTCLTGQLRMVEIQDRGKSRELIAARLLVGADGANSVVRRALGAQPSPPRHTGIAIRAYARSDAFDSNGPRMIFSFGRELLPAYAWLFPTGRGIVNIGVGGSLATLRKSGHDLRRMLAAFAGQVRSQGIDLEEPYALRAHHLPHFGGMPKLIYPRAALIGDAASMINSFSGEGISYGMAAGVRLAQLVPVDIGSGMPINSALTQFQHDFLRDFRAHTTAALLLHKLMRSPTRAKIIISAGGRNPSILHDVTELLIGFGRVSVTMPVRILRSHRSRSDS